MVHRVALRVVVEDALSFWEERLGREGVEATREGRTLRFADPEGLGLELRVVETADRPLVAASTEVPREHALQGFDGVRAYARDPERSRVLLEQALGFRSVDAAGWEVRGFERGGLYAYDPSERPGVSGAGTVHHVAWASRMQDHEAWRLRAAEAGASPTPVIDRFWFRAVYFREPSGVLFEIATIGPGFDADEPLEHLGERLVLPPAYEALRSRVEPILTPLPDTTRWRPAPAVRPGA